MRRKLLFFSLCLLLLAYVVPTLSQGTDDGDKYKKPTIDVIADEDVPAPTAGIFHFLHFFF